MFSADSFEKGLRFPFGAVNTLGNLYLLSHFEARLPELVEWLFEPPRQTVLTFDAHIETRAHTVMEARVPRLTLAGLPAGSLDNQARPQAARLKVIRQQHDAVGIEPLRLQGVDAPQDLLLFQIDHRDRPVTHAFQIEQAILDEEVPFIGRQDAMMGAGGGGDRFEKLRLLRIAVVV